MSFMFSPPGEFEYTQRTMYAHTHAVDLLADVLGSQLRVEGEGGAARPKVLDDLSVEGIVTHLRKIMTSDDSEPQCVHGMLSG